MSESWVATLSIYVPAAIILLLLLYLIFRIVGEGKSRLKKFAYRLGVKPSTALIILLFLPITLPLGLLYGLLKPLFLILKPYLKEIYYFFVGLFKILLGLIAGVTRLGKQNTLESPSRTALGELEQLSVRAYRTYGQQKGIAPTSKTSDLELLGIIKDVHTLFTKAAEQKCEHIPATYLMTINVKFFQVYERLGKEAFTEHLKYEVNKYLSNGLREDYKVDLGII